MCPWNVELSSSTFVHFTPFPTIIFILSHHARENHTRLVVVVCMELIISRFRLTNLAFRVTPCSCLVCGFCDIKKSVRANTRSHLAGWIGGGEFLAGTSPIRRGLQRTTGFMNGRQINKQ